VGDSAERAEQAEERADASSTGLLVAAFGLVLLGIVVLIVGTVASLEPASLVAGLALVAAGLGFAFALGYVDARHAGKGIPRAIGRGFLNLFVWLTLLP
jgi:uncharacterized membrane protein